MGSNSGSHGRHRIIGAVMVVGVLALAACASGGDDAATEESADMDVPAAEEPADEPAEVAGDAGDAAGGDGAAIDLGIVGRDVIIEMHVTMSSDDIQRAVAGVTARASALGGGVAASDVNYGRPGDGTEGYAVLTVKVPPTALDDLLAGLEQAGTVQSISQSAQDVTEQLVDLDVRITNARQSVENVRRFMERTEDLSELVTLEGELTRRQTELERLEAQQRNLSDRVALSTVTIEIIPTAAVPEPEEDDSIGDAFRQGWDGFVTFVWGIGYVLAVLAPFLVLGAIVALAVLTVLRRRHREPTRGTGAEPAPPTRDGPPR